MHWKNKMVYLNEMQQKDDFTWKDSNVMCENHKFIAGPKQAQGSSMIFYLQKYEAISSSTDPMTGLMNNAKEFKGHSIVLQPPADLSCIDILPQLSKNHNNYSSYIDSEHIMIRFSGRFLVFHNGGKYLG